jgi:hypothetical protein
MEGLMEEAVKTGNLWIILFVALLVYFVKDSKIRETKYQETIQKNQEIIQNCSVNCEINKEIKTEISEIKKDTEEIKSNILTFRMTKGGKI